MADSGSSAQDLDREIEIAHKSGDAHRLIELYTRAADLHEQAGNIDAACFFLTNALVFALQEGVAVAQTLRQRLHDHGREEL